MHRHAGVPSRRVGSRGNEALCGQLKSGVGKTTSTVHLALGRARSGRTLLVDADPEQPQAHESSDMTDGWPHDRCEVVPLADRRLAQWIGPMMASHEHVVFDVEPKNPALLRQAMSPSDDLLVQQHVVLATATKAPCHHAPSPVVMVGEIMDYLGNLRLPGDCGPVEESRSISGGSNAHDSCDRALTGSQQYSPKKQR
jgi:CobQ/CobB/MinD/ParA family nucleotide binding protein